MGIRRRLAAALAVASGAAVAGALGTGLNLVGVASAAGPGTQVHFTSEPATSPLVAHYTVTPVDQEKETPASNEESRGVTLSPKHAGQDVARSASSSATARGERSDNTQAASGESDPGNTPSPAASFIGQQASNKTCSYFAKGCNPPDMALAASPDFVFQGVNSQWEVLDTSGNIQPGWPVSAQNFFGVKHVTNDAGAPCDVAHQSQPFMSDPRAIYDSRSHRFWAAMLQVENGLGLSPDCAFKSVYYIAVSRTSNPGGSWNVYEFDMAAGTPFAADYTQIGLTADAIYFSGNMFGPNNGFYAEIFEADKAKMERGQGGFSAAGFKNLRATGPGTTTATGPFLADTVQPAINLEARGSQVFVDTFDGPDPLTGNFCTSAADSCSGLALWKFTNPIGHDRGGPMPTLTGSYVPSKPFAFPPAADQPGCNACIDGNDLRIGATPVVRNGVLYASWGTAISNGTNVDPGIVCEQFRLSNPSGTAQSGYYNFSGDAAAIYPVVMPDSQGNLVMLFDYMSSAVNPQTRYTVRQAGETQFSAGGVVLKAGESPYRPPLCPVINPCRWGDYSAASDDGAGKVWFAGQYANHFDGANNPPAFGRNWGTWIGALGSENN